MMIMMFTCEKIRRSFNISPFHRNGFVPSQVSCLLNPKFHYCFSNFNNSVLSLLAHHLKPRLCHNSPDPISSLLDSCKNLQSLRQTHASLILSNGTDELARCSAFGPKLIALYAKFNDLDSPFAILKSMKEQTTFPWNFVLKAHVTSGQVESAFGVYRKMRDIGVEHDCYTFPIINQAALLSRESVLFGKIIHCLAFQMGFGRELYFCNTMMEVYVRNGSLGDACKLFVEMPYRDIVSWTAMISGYFNANDFVSAFRLFNEMRIALEPNAVTMLIMLKLCSSIIQATQFHGYLLKNGFLVDRSVVNSLLNVYAHMGKVADAEVLFEDIDRDIVSWNIMLSLYSITGETRRMTECYHQMSDKVELGSEALNVLVSGLASSGNLIQARLLHCLVMKKGIYDDKLRTSLLNFYAKCGEIAMSTSLFEEIRDKSPVTWNAMMSAHLQNGLFEDAIELFKHLLSANLQPTAENLTSLLVAYTNIGMVRLARGVHGYSIRNSSSESTDKHILETSILNMYVRCGSIYAARICFDKMANKDGVAWTSMIEGYGNHGMGLEALQLFHTMVNEGVKPNSVTFLSLLSACSHSGLWSESYEILYWMKWKFKIEPNLNHYTCIVDMLGRLGRLKDALTVLLKFVAFPDSRIWGALLAASRVHADKRLGEYAAKRLLELEPDNVGYHTILSNMEASVERWTGVEEVRSTLQAKDLLKQPGWSCIEVKGANHGFVSGDRSHLYSADIYKILHDLNKIVHDTSL